MGLMWIYILFKYTYLTFWILTYFIIKVVKRLINRDTLLVLRYLVYTYEMRISENKRWSRAVCARKIWHCAIYYVIKKCQKSTNDKLDKCMHSVVLCSICRNLYRTESIRNGRLLREAIVNMLHRKIRANDGFGVSKVVTSRLQTRNTGNPQKFEKVELQVLLDEDDS